MRAILKGYDGFENHAPRPICTVSFAPKIVEPESVCLLKAYVRKTGKNNILNPV